MKTLSKIFRVLGTLSFVVIIIDALVLWYRTIVVAADTAGVAAAILTALFTPFAQIYWLIASLFGAGLYNYLTACVFAAGAAFVLGIVFHYISHYLKERSAI